VVVDIRLLPGKVQVVRGNEVLDESPRRAAAPEWALEFDGKTSYVELPPVPFDPKKGLTVEAYVLPLLNGDGQEIIQSEDKLGGFGLSISPSEDSFGFAFVSDVQKSAKHWYGAFSKAPPPFGSWGHMAAVFDGTRLRLFLDGHEVPRSVFTWPYNNLLEKSEVFPGVARPPSAPVLLGCRDHPAPHHFKGRLSSVRFSHGARYLGDFTPPKRYEPDKETIALYRFDEGRGDKLIDSSGHGKDGKIVGARWMRAAAPLPAGALEAVRGLARVSEENRALAAWAIKVGAKVSVQGRDALNLADVDGANLTALHIDLNWLRLPEKVLVAQLGKGRVVGLNLGGWKVSEAGWQRVAAHPELLSLGLRSSNCDDRTIALFRPLKQMTWVDLGHCNITDQSLPVLAEWTSLYAVYLDQTSVTFAGVKKLARALPRCRIVCAHGIFGPPGPGLRFDGKTSYVEIPSLRLDAEQPVTLEGWVTVDREQDAMLLVRVAGKSWMSLSAGAGMWGVVALHDNQQQGVAAPNRVTAGVKTHVAGVWDGKALRLFVNGREYTDRLAPAQRPGTIRSGQAGTTQIGGAPGSNAFLAGTVHAIRVSRTARYTGGFAPAARPEADADTLALYHFDEGRGDVLKDLSRNGHHGTIVGAKWVK
jgi:hypothetical protein